MHGKPAAQAGGPSSKKTACAATVAAAAWRGMQRCRAPHCIVTEHKHMGDGQGCTGGRRLEFDVVAHAQAVNVVARKLADAAVAVKQAMLVLSLPLTCILNRCARRR
jgi:hypothetical protein